MSTRFSCSRAAKALAEPRYGTASQVRRWILVEQTGPWGADAVLESRLPRRVASVLRSRAQALRARVLLIRRPGRSAPAGRRCFVACTTARVQWVERLTFGEAEQLLEVDWSPLGRDRTVGGTPVPHPLFLVCTNGRHDPCCAEYGRPLAHALEASLGEHVWESSHFGGDRFAGNLVCLPHGLYFGHVSPAAGLRIASGYQRGLVDLQHFRGRSCYPFAVQAGEFFVRERHGLRHVDDLTLRAVERAGAGRSRMTFSDRRGQRHVVTVEVTESPDEQLVTCRTGRPSRPPRYRLQDLRSHPG